MVLTMAGRGSSERRGGIAACVIVLVLASLIELWKTIVEGIGRFDVFTCVDYIVVPILALVVALGPGRKKPPLNLLPLVVLAVSAVVYVVYLVVYYGVGIGGVLSLIISWYRGFLSSIMSWHQIAAVVSILIVGLCFTGKAEGLKSRLVIYAAVLSLAPVLLLVAELYLSLIHI